MYKTKQGTKSLMQIRLPFNIDQCSKLEFIFEQGDALRYIEYPRDAEAFVKLTERTIGIAWTPLQKSAFKPNKAVRMDTRATLKDCEYQPMLEIVEFEMLETLFEEVAS